MFVVAIVIAVAALAILLVAGVPDLFDWVHERTGRAPTLGLEIIVRRRFAIDWENSRTHLVGADLIVPNNSTVNVTITQIGLRPVDFPGPTKLVGGRLPETIERGKALYRTIKPFDFTDILNQTSNSDLPSEPIFLIYIESGYGSATKTCCSEPFTLISGSSEPLNAGFSEWTE